MTTVSPDVDVDDITHLDHAPPCSVETCGGEATWAVFYRDFPPCEPTTYLLCGPHVDFVRNCVREDRLLACRHVGIIGPIRHHLDRIEPL